MTAAEWDLLVRWFGITPAQAKELPVVTARWLIEIGGQS